MQAGQHLQMLTAQPFFAAIMGMDLQGKLGIVQPAAQRFGIDAEATSRLGHRHKGHGAPPFTWCMEQEREPAWENTQEFSQEFSLNKCQEISLESSPEFSWEEERQGARHRGLAGFFATATVIIASPILVGAPKPR